MNMLSSGDLVKPKLGGQEMIVVGVADFHRDRPEALSVFCVWDEDHFLREEVFQTRHLALIRKERRRSLRRSDVEYRACAPSRPTAGIELQDVSLSMDGQRVTFYVQVSRTARKFALISAARCPPRSRRPAGTRWRRSRRTARSSSWPASGKSAPTRAFPC